MQITGKENVYQDIKSKILTLEMPPGKRLDEATLCCLYGLSRTPLREVFQRLAGEGYIQLEAHRGAKVSTMEFADMRDFFHSAPTVYGAVARLAAERANAEQIAALKDTQVGFRNAAKAEQPSDMAIFNNRFHRIIGEMSGNAYLLPSLNRLLIDHARMSQVFYRPATLPERQLVDKACLHHDEMIEAIAAHDASRMIDLTLEHWNLSRHRLEKFAMPDASPDALLTEGKQKHAL